MRKIVLILILIMNDVISFSQCSPFQVQLNTLHISCNGAADGLVEANSLAGSPPYQYYWGGPSNFTSSDSIISNLIAGTYSLTVVDANNCQSIPTFTVVDEPIFSLQLGVNNVSCYGGNNGEVLASVTGGFQPFTYLWSNTSQNSSIISDLFSGNYSVIVTDANGCQKQESINVSEEDSLHIFLDSLINISCNGSNDGYVQIDPVGGGGTFSYLWTGPNNYINPNPIKELSGLYAGDYSVSVTDQNNCQAVLNFLLSEPDSITTSSLISDASCFGLNDGQISINVLGGVIPYSYIWNNGATNNMIDSLSIGTYSISILDSHHCAYQQSFLINQPNILALSLQKSDISCFGLSDGVIDLSIIGGTLPYSINWNNSSFTEDIYSLSEGEYSVLVTDFNNCLISDSVSILEPALLEFSLDSVKSLDCFEDSSGYIALNSIGGVGVHSFIWLDDSSTSSVRNNLSADIYEVIVSDSNNCTESIVIGINGPDEINIEYHIYPNLCYGDSSASIIIDSISGGVGGNFNLLWGNSSVLHYVDNLFQDSLSLIVYDSLSCSESFIISIPSPDSLSISFSSSFPSCTNTEDGYIMATPTGGVGDYIYNWSMSISSGPLIPLIDSTLYIDSLSQGAYFLSIIDSNGCSLTSSTGMSTPNPIISVITNHTPVSCNGGTDGALEVNSSGGTPPFNYVCSNGDSTNPSYNAEYLADSLQAGLYLFTTYDNNGCETQISATVNEPSSLSISSTSLPPMCYDSLDGSLILSVSGGTYPYSHNWSNGDTNSILVDGSGFYSDTILDANNCEIIFSDFILDPSPLQINGTIEEVSCYGLSDGEINLLISGGMSPYNYLWSNGTFQNDIDSLIAGNYIVTVIDANSCIETDSFLVNQPSSELIILSNITNPGCFNSSDGIIDLQVSGGDSPYQFLWNDGDTLAQKINVQSGMYIVNISDLNSCNLLDTIFINAPDSIVANVIVDSVSCFGIADGQALVNISGGITPYSIEWFNGFSNNLITGLSVGSFSFEISDSNNCLYNNQIEVFGPIDLSISLQTSNISCNGMNNGEIITTVIGGTQPYYYYWSNGDTTTNAQNLSSGLYSVVISDANNCSGTQFEVINEPTVLYATINTNDVNCYGNNSGSIDLSVSGGIQPYSYSWNNGDSSEDLDNIGAGIYSVTISDVNNCTQTLLDTVLEPSSILIIDSITHVNCANLNNGSIFLDVTGGVSPYNFVWNSGQNTAEIQQLSPNQYSVLIIDENGCNINYSAIIQSVNPIIIADSIIHETCIGASNGQVAINISGGYSPYTVNWQNGSNGAVQNNLAAGIYNFSVIDSVNCITTSNVLVSAGSTFDIEYVLTDVDCFGDSTGTIIIEIINGVSPYQVNWSDEVLAGLERDKLLSGIYSAHITDFNMCENTIQFEIVEPEELFAQFDVLNISCSSISDGEAIAYVSGGISPYSYNWSNGSIEPSIADLSEGLYAFQIVDQNLCELNDSVEILSSSDCFVVPSVFTPNNDGVNDSWKIENDENIGDYQLQIINENGLLVYEASENIEWDGTYNGKQVEANTYYYLIIMNDGEIISGSITLIR